METALEVVEMYINTRGVGLAEAFEEKCREEHGLPPNRRWEPIGTVCPSAFGPKLSADAARSANWSTFFFFFFQVP